MATPSQGTAFADGVRIGSYQNKDFEFGCLGLPISPRIRYRLKPAGIANIFGTVSGAVISSAGQITLVSSPPSTNFVSFQGYSNVVQLDCARGITFSVLGAALSAPIVFTISGWDFYGHKTVENVTVPSGADDQVYSSNKTYSYIKSIYASAGSGTTQVSIDTGPTFGFPYYIPHQTFVLASLNGAPDYGANITAGTGTYYLISPHSAIGSPLVEDYAAIVVGDSTDPATATTKDPRGLYYPNPTLFLGNGSDVIEMDFFVPGFDCQAGTNISPSSLPPSQSYCYGVTQYSTGWQ